MAQRTGPFRLLLRRFQPANRRCDCFLSTTSGNFNSANPKQPSDLKGRSPNAQRWLLRQFKDPYVLRSKLENYRCRSAFKLIEIDDKYKFLRPGSRVVDCGAAPGSWTQVAVKRINALGQQKGAPVGRIVAVDKNSVAPVDGAYVLSYHDFTKEETRKEILAYFASDSKNDGLIDVVLSDMAPSATGNSCDHERIIELAYEALVFAARHLSNGGYYLTKIWTGRSEGKLHKDMEKLFEYVYIMKPNASREDSTEVFLLGRQFKGVKRDA